MKMIDLLQTVIDSRYIRQSIRCYERGPRGGWKRIRR